MQQDRKQNQPQRGRNQDQDAPTRSSNMEKAEGSREQMIDRGTGEGDLGTSSDRAMFDTEGEPRRKPGERNRNSSGSGISNRGSDEERSRQERVPERGKSQSEC